MPAAPRLLTRPLAHAAATTRTCCVPNPTILHPMPLRRATAPSLCSCVLTTLCMPARDDPMAARAHAPLRAHADCTAHMQPTAQPATDSSAPGSHTATSPQPAVDTSAPGSMAPGSMPCLTDASCGWLSATSTNRLVTCMGHSGVRTVVTRKREDVACK